VNTQPRFLRLALAAVLSAGALALAGCATNPVTGRSELSLVSPEQEGRVGREGHAAIVEEYGEYDDPKLQAYVDSVGQALARNSHLPNLAWKFTVLDDPTVNAFATPGGYVYVTRGILAHLNSEAQLAGVIGHEIGHVTARHGAQRMTQQQIAGLGFGLASIFSETFRRYSDAAQTGLSLMLLKYGRDDENQADQLGVDYTTKSGWDPREIPATYTMLARIGVRSGQRLPAFLSTHPDPGDREVRTRALSVQAAGGRTDLRTNARGYVSRLEGVVFGRDPRQGYFDGERYYHPGLALEMRFPPGWETQDTRSALLAVDPEKHAQMQMSLAAPMTEAPVEYVTQLVNRGKITGMDGRAETLAGWPAWVGRVEVADVQGNRRQLASAFVRRGGEPQIQVLGASAAVGDALEGRIFESIRSMRRLTDPGRMNPAPARVKIVRAGVQGTLVEVLPRFGVQGINAEDTSILNNLPLDDVVRVGETLKIVAPSRLK
jgi:predicted Zn-dependent protease